MKKENILHQERIAAQKNKTYFLDLKEAENGSNYLVINQIIQTGETKERKRLIFFEKELAQFGESMIRIIMKFKASNRSEEYIAKIRKEYPNAFQPWKPEDDFTLKAMVKKSNELSKMAKHFGRKETAIIARMKKLNIATAEYAQSA